MADACEQPSTLDPRPSALALLAGLSLASACSDYTLVDHKGDEAEPVDTGGTSMEPDDHVAGFGDCYSTSLVTPVLSASDPSHPYVCGYRHAGEQDIYNADVSLSRLAVYGQDGTANPTSLTVGVGFLPKDEGATYPGSAYASDPLTPSGDASTWIAVAGTSQVGTLNTCTEHCSFEPIVEINDTPRALAGTCSEYAGVGWCPDYIDTNARRRIPFSTTCVAGSGTFALIPMRTYDKDLDGASTVMFRPVKSSGSGSLTAAAWITQAQALVAEGQTISVIRANKDYHVGVNDMLDTPSVVSRPVPNTTITYPVNAVAGNAPFIIEEAPGTMPPDLSVALTWTCGTYQSNEEANTEQGYAFRLSDLGCPVSWPQVFTMRPSPALAPTRMEFSLYGSLTDVHSAPITMVGNERRFRFQEHDLSMSGALLSWGASGAVVRVDSVTWEGTNVCVPGTYTLPTEE